MMGIKTIADDELLERLKVLVRQEREDTAAVVEHLAEVDRRDLVQERGYASLFEYCMSVLAYSEPSAYHRIRAARAIRKKPYLLALLRSGELHLGAIVLLHPHLDDPRADEIVRRACGKSKREIAAFLAPFDPQPWTRDEIRLVAIQPMPGRAASLPGFDGPPSGAPMPPAGNDSPRSGSTSFEPCSGGLFSGNAPSRSSGASSPSTTVVPPPGSVNPLVGEDLPLFEASMAGGSPASSRLRAQVSFSAGPVFIDLLERAKNLLWHKFPGGRLEDVFSEALRVLLADKDPGLWEAPERPTLSAGRRIPKWIRRQVWKRDGGRCSFVAADGRRCGSQTGLEFDHVVPWRHGGPSNDPANIRLLCRAHNQWTARQ